MSNQIEVTIEKKREELIRSVDKNGISSTQTIIISQELDTILNNLLLSLEED
ncbi:aspartyl-phosphate phosphatase Spo0E family protein [Alkalicoccus chagannorensis]|uniref:aspartyl-phosphate phosphatase Spo0E family protein n=1 Tax=Alkalicoccus chagannorensis TaxID=427072 RepID=UPI0009FEB7F8|nr:aspartyl-phosphate phosphatase Spo0E family protein [Alkalicoccus chagannorensis]